jgi:hypothetical protein
MVDGTLGWEAPVMNPDQTNETPPEALELRDRLIELQAERVMTLGTPLADVRSYMADLDEEIEATRQLYVFTAVLEIAALRAELFGAQEG